MDSEFRTGFRIRGKGLSLESIDYVTFAEAFTVAELYTTRKENSYYVILDKSKEESYQVVFDSEFREIYKYNVYTGEISIKKDWEKKVR